MDVVVVGVGGGGGGGCIVFQDCRVSTLTNCPIRKVCSSKSNVNKVRAPGIDPGCERAVGSASFGSQTFAAATIQAAPQTTDTRTGPSR